MTIVGYHASHEQFKPSTLLNYVQLAEKAGFDAVSSSDHFHPWSNNQGESGFAWSWLGAAMQATKLLFGVVNAPGQRYHPAIIAQASATLAEMFPNRFWLAQGSGQALNEMITGDKWPAKGDRNERLEEAVTVIKHLWTGEKTNFTGKHITVEEAILYTPPAVNPLIVGAAVTAKTAEWVASWADALITISRAPHELKKVVEAFKRGGGEGKPMYLKVQMSYAKDETSAREGAYEQWKSNIFDSNLLSDLRLPEQFDVAAKFVKPADLDEFVLISSNPQQHVDWLAAYAELGFEHLYLHNVNLEHETFIQDFGEKVLPALKQL